MELGIPVVIALNIYDEAEKKGFRIDAKSMEDMLGITVIRTVATRKTGLSDLLKSAISLAEEKPSRVPLLHIRELPLKESMRSEKIPCRGKNLPRELIGYSCS